MAGLGAIDFSGCWGVLLNEARVSQVPFFFSLMRGANTGMKRTAFASWLHRTGKRFFLTFSPFCFPFMRMSTSKMG